ncbi:hypothetical protein H2203_000620 [Taxawa tesnikishii (nom. ined.)]|nr:hypothetical protein H2203_000620 [Dothideales sp. JES 119]
MAAPNMATAVGAQYALGNSMMPNAGHHLDMQQINQLIELLAQQLAENRERVRELTDQLEKVQVGHVHDFLCTPLISPKRQANTRSTNNGSNGALRRSSSNLSLPNGDTNAHSPSQQAQNPDTFRLISENSSLQTRLTGLESAYSEQTAILTTYETAFEDIMERLRTYSYSHTSSLTALHAHYNSLLTQSRNETMQAQLTHQGWQASLGRLHELLRAAYKESEDGSLSYRRRIAALKSENKLLRAKAGWEPASDSEDDEGVDVEGRTNIEQ